MNKIIAWIKKYLLKVQSPSMAYDGHRFEWDRMKEVSNGKTKR